MEDLGQRLEKAVADMGKTWAEDQIKIRQKVDAYLKSLPEDERAALISRAEMLAKRYEEIMRRDVIIS